MRLSDFYTARRCENIMGRMIGALSAALIAASASAGPPNCPGAGMVLHEAKISDTEGGFEGELAGGDEFGVSVANLGDLDRDGIADLAVGAFGDDGGGTWRGAVWVLFMNVDGTVRSEQEISDTAGGFMGVLDNNDLFGVSVAGLGDLDGDSVPDIAVGAHGDDDGGADRGAVWVLFLNPNGTVRAEQKISDTSGGFNGALDNGDTFGWSIAGLGDLDGDGGCDLAVGAFGDDDGGMNRGAVWILFMNSNGTVRAEQKISDTSGSFDGVLNNDDWFGISVGSTGDIDGDGVPELGVGAILDGDGGPARGAVWILFMKIDGTVRAHQKISDTIGGFNGALDNDDNFGASIAGLADIDGDGVPDLAVGAHGDDDGGVVDRGAVWILFLKTDGSVKAEQKISDTAGGFDGALDSSDGFGRGLAILNDCNGDDVPDLAVGTWLDDDGGTNRGAVWILSLDGCPLTPPCCPGNADGIGTVNFADITCALTNFGALGTPGEQNPGDADCDGVVNFADVTSVLTFFNSSCR